MPHPNPSPDHLSANQALRRLHRYLRRDGTVVAVALRVLSPTRGLRYTSSRTKRVTDLVVGVPASMAALPIVAFCAAVNRIVHPTLPAFYVQARAGQGTRLRIVKLRSMVPRNATHRAARHLHEPERVTFFGHRMRLYYLDELPQLWPVVRGSLSVVGIRVLPIPVYEHLRATWSPQRFATWSDVYRSSRLGLTGIHQVYRGMAKEDEKRFHRDVFYARHASLGLDLYILWLTVYRLISALQTPSN